MSREQRGAAGAPPGGVAERLAALRAVYTPEHRSEAYARLAKERPSTTESFARAVARRLRDLRALCELARHLHRTTLPGVPRR
jgi:hypothetical protein